MPSSERRLPRPPLRARLAGLAAAACVSTLGAHAGAQEQAQGFAAERFYASAPGGGWLVMDDLAISPGLGGALSLTTGYAKNPLHASLGGQRLELITKQGFVDFGAAISYERVRLYLNLESPLVSKGESGTLGRYQLTAPAVDLGANPDTFADARIGADVRLLGELASPLRLGVGAQLWVPNGARSDYDTDGTYRAMGRLLLAGDWKPLLYAGHVGVHLRPLSDAESPGSPRGSELLFGLAVGPRLPLDERTALVVGPEVFGETAFRVFGGRSRTGLEALLGVRLERTADDGASLRVKLGVGGGLHPEFGAPDARAVLSLELGDHVR